MKYYVEINFKLIIYSLQVFQHQFLQVKYQAVLDPTRNRADYL